MNGCGLADYRLAAHNDRSSPKAKDLVALMRTMWLQNSYIINGWLAGDRRHNHLIAIFDGIDASRDVAMSCLFEYLSCASNGENYWTKLPKTVEKLMDALQSHRKSFFLLWVSRWVTENENLSYDVNTLSSNHLMALYYLHECLPEQFTPAIIDEIVTRNDAFLPLLFYYAFHNGRETRLAWTIRHICYEQAHRFNRKIFTVHSRLYRLCKLSLGMINNVNGQVTLAFLLGDELGFAHRVIFNGLWCARRASGSDKKLAVINRTLDYLAEVPLRDVAHGRAILLQCVSMLTARTFGSLHGLRPYAETESYYGCRAHFKAAAELLSCSVQLRQVINREVNVDVLVPNSGLRFNSLFRSAELIARETESDAVADIELQVMGSEGSAATTQNSVNILNV